MTDMHDKEPLASHASSFRSGDWVEVRTQEEIFATLDSEGRLDAIPFMPEMLEYCGKMFRVYKSAHKTCDTIHKTGARAMTGAVHLEGLRCNGKSHGGCQAACLLFWKDAWLRPARNRDSGKSPAERLSGTIHESDNAGFGCTVETLAKATRVPADDKENGTEAYRCQATELFRATTPLKWWDPRHYIRDLTSRNVRPLSFVRYIVIAGFNLVLRLHWRLRQYPDVRGLAKGRTPAAVLNLQPGELVRVRSKSEIMHTLNADQRNRGLWFDVEMVPYCEKTFRVLSRVEKIIDERTGKMIKISNDCIILDGVTCGGCLSRNRLFCPRGIYSYWREIWLKRVEER